MRGQQGAKGMGRNVQASHIGNTLRIIRHWSRTWAQELSWLHLGSSPSLQPLEMQGTPPRVSRDLPVGNMLAAILFHDGSQNPRENFLNMHAHAHTQHLALSSLRDLIHLIHTTAHETG